MVFLYIHIIVFCSYSPHPLYWLSSSTKYFPLIFYLRNLTYAERWKKWYYSLPSKIYYLTRFSSLVCLLDTGLYVFWFLLFFFQLFEVGYRYFMYFIGIFLLMGRTKTLNLSTNESYLGLKSTTTVNLLIITFFFFFCQIIWATGA